MKRSLIFTFTLLIGAFVFGILGAYTFEQLNTPKSKSTFAQATPNDGIIRTNNGSNLAGNIDFVVASEKSTPTVVYIKTTTTQPQRSFNDWFFGDFFGSQERTVMSSGSGVIISPDGYIVSNNHVVEKAIKIEIVLNSKQTYEAKLIGTDPSTDLALLKIEGKNLPTVQFANSNNVKVGEWVVAVGNPFNLTSTVTAGIVSAKGRNLNIVNNLFPIESFIQTDAAINPGNSGGALVNLNGELVGINTAIYTRTGAYNGYGFAIPANIVQKIVRDLKEFGTVQRAFWGGDVKDLDAQTFDRLNLKELKGVHVHQISGDGNAEKAGLKVDDIVLSVNKVPVNSKGEFDEQISYQRPGERAEFEIIRKGKIQVVNVQLTNSEGTTEVLIKETFSSDKLGANLELISKVEREKYNINSGVRFYDIRAGIIQQMGLKDGFVLISVNKIPVKTTQQAEELLASLAGNIVIEGITPEGRRSTYSFYRY